MTLLASASDYPELGSSITAFKRVMGFEVDCSTILMILLILKMVEDKAVPKKEPFEIKFVESFDKEDEDKLAAFLGKVTGSLANGDESVPDGVSS
jgi:uncharacterized membrane protein